MSGVMCVCGRGGMMRESYIKCLKTIVFHKRIGLDFVAKSCGFT